MKKKKSRVCFLVTLLTFLFVSFNALASDVLFLDSLGSPAVGVRLDYASNQLYILTERELKLFDLKTVKPVSSYKFGVSERPLRLDLFDVDGDGKLEALVTSVLSKRLSSYLFDDLSLRAERNNLPDNLSSLRAERNNLADNSSSLRGAKRRSNPAESVGFKIILKDLPYFLRVEEVDGTERLLGQKSTRVNPYAGSVQLLTYNNGKVKGGEAVDLPKQTGIYDFAFSTVLNRVWVRESGGRLRLFEKQGRKWKKIYKSTELFRGNVNCFSFTEVEPIEERLFNPVCVPTPPVVFRKTEDLELKTQDSRPRVSKDGRWSSVAAVDDVSERIIVDDHKFLLNGVILRPSPSKEAFMYELLYGEGLSECNKWGPFQGWIGDYFIEETKEGGLNLLLVRNEKGGVRIQDIDITRLDCEVKF